MYNIAIVSLVLLVVIYFKNVYVNFEKKLANNILQKNKREFKDTMFYKHSYRNFQVNFVQY